MVKLALLVVMLAAVCSSAAMARSTEDKYVTLQKPACGFCKTLVKEMFNFLRDNRTEESVRDSLDKVCDLIFKDKSRNQQCNHFVATYSKELVEILVDETDPELICMLLGQCVYEVKKTTVYEDSEPQPLEETEVAKSDEGSTESDASSKNIGLSEFISLLDPSIATGSARTCIECKLFINYLQTTVQDPKSQEEIKDWLLKNLCDSLMENELKSSCRNMVNLNAKAFFQAIAAQLDAKTTCVEFGACRRGIFLIDNLLRKPITNEVPVRPTESSAFPDKFYRLSLYNDVMELIAKMDDKLDAPVEEKSESVVLSTSSSSNDNQEKSAVCDQCVQIVTKLDEYISSHTVDHDVDVLVEEVCNKIPQENAKNECTLLVKAFGEDIIQAISTMKNPQELCSRIMLC